MKSTLVNVKSQDDGAVGDTPDTGGARGQQPPQQENPSSPCCRKRCCKCVLMPFYYIFLFLLYLIGFVLFIAFSTVHLVMRLLHFLFKLLAGMRRPDSDPIDMQRLSKEHEEQYKKDVSAYKVEVEKRRAQRAQRKAGARRDAENPAGSSDDSDPDEPSPHQRLCGFSCVCCSIVSCFGMLFFGIAFIFFTTGYMMGFGAASVLSWMFPSCTLRAVQYLAAFRDGNDAVFYHAASSEKK
jgi:hypothetical protein